MVKRVLVIAFHFPPLDRGSGYLRTLKFCQYLPQFEWEPIVLTVHPRAHGISAPEDRYPDGGHVVRAFALDAKLHLSIRGKYPSVFAVPDRWSSWWFGGVLQGLQLIRKYRPDVVFSTYPIATAHLIGMTLRKLTGIPWVADFRDPMIGDVLPRQAIVRKTRQWIERKTVQLCDRCVFTTPSARRAYALRYGELPAAKWCEIANGYDEESFRDLDAVQPGPRDNPQQCVLVHSGLLYREERDPRCFFQALGELRAEGAISSKTLKVILRASGSEDYYAELVAGHGIGDIVHLEGAIPYSEALTEMLSAQGLLLFQATCANHQIPAKVYEYFRARRPILALTDPSGDTASTLAAAGYSSIARLDSVAEIKEGLMAFLEAVRAGHVDVASQDEVERHSRRGRAGELAKLLDGLGTQG